jgi:Phosphotransferase enzyme family
VGLLHLTEYPQQVIELLGVDGGLEQGHRGVAAGFDSWRQPQSDRGEIIESPDTALTEGDPAEGLQRLGKAAQVLTGFGVDPADERVRRERKNESPDGTLALDLTHTRELHTHVAPVGIGQGGTRPGWPPTWSQRRTPEQQRAALPAPMAGDYRADTTLVCAVLDRASAGFVHRDYHPAQMLFEGSRVTGICDWLTACRGPHGIDLACA